MIGLRPSFFRFFEAKLAPLVLLGLDAREDCCCWFSAGDSPVIAAPTYPAFLRLTPSSSVSPAPRLPKVSQSLLFVDALDVMEPFCWELALFAD